jgi:hypothetical protein
VLSEVTYQLESTVKKFSPATRETACWWSPNKCLPRTSDAFADLALSEEDTRRDTFLGTAQKDEETGKPGYEFVFDVFVLATGW